MRRLLGLLVSALAVGAAIAVWRPRDGVGYVEIKTVPLAPVTQMVLYIDGTKLAPIKAGSAILRQRVGTLRLQADDLTGSLEPLCDIVVTKNRITTVMVSILEPSASLPMPVQRHEREYDGSPHLPKLSGRFPGNNH
jgi:hypothetical protein